MQNEGQFTHDDVLVEEALRATHQDEIHDRIHEDEIHDRIIDEIDDYEYIALDYIQDKMQDYSGIVDFANSLYSDQIDVREAMEFVQREHVQAADEDEDEDEEEYLP